MVEKLIQKAEVLLEALPYIRKFRGRTFVIKYGGSAMVNEELRETFARDVVLLKLVGINPVIVHGGGKHINRMLQQLGIEVEFVGGIRKTTEEVMHIVEMVLSGDINKDIVALINKHSGEDVYAVGLSGRDGRLLRARKIDRSYFVEKLGIEPPSADIGLVGEITSVNTRLLQVLIAQNYIPVIAPIGVGEEGEAYNINADIAAAEVAKALKAEKLIFLTDTEGVKDKNGNLIKKLKDDRVEELIKDGTIGGGMIPKVRSAVEALKGGVKKVHIVDGRLPHSILLEIFTDEGVGTEITLKTP
ncbi:MAG TPA: acetylglutamate kinase [Aquificales bacterium]|nr:acetylglutamate kinase [Aquificales bacterium]HIO41956.1 acetylglutamate kinase [Aquifex sp.]